MRLFHCLVILLPFALANCGGTTEKTTIVNPQPGQTVVVPGNGNAHVCPAGTTSC